MKHEWPIETKVITNLRLTLGHLKEHGWRRYGQELRGAVCLQSALNRVGGGDDGPAADAIRKVIGQHCIWEWNDRKGRTWEEVEAAILKAMEE